MTLNEVNTTTGYHVYLNNPLLQLFDVVDVIAVRGYDENRQVIYWNKGSELLYGYNKNDAIGKNIESLIINEPINKQMIEIVDNCFKDDIETLSSEFMLRNQKGENLYVYSTLVLYVNPQNEKFIYCFDVNLSSLKLVNSQVNDKESILDSTFKVIPDLFFVMKQDTTIVDYYASDKTNLYIPPEKFIGKLMTDVLPAEVADKFTFNIAKLLTQKINQKKSSVTETVYFEYAMALPQGELFFEARMTYLADSNKIVTIVRDITKQHQAAESIRKHAYYDTLTGLPNRFLALDRLSQLINEAPRNNEKIAVLFLDLDDFKIVNDTLGHEAGDKLLIESATRLNKVVRKEDTVGRIGGDEFIVLLKGIIDEHNVLTIVENLLNIFRKPFEIDSREVMVTLSIGISLYPENGKNTGDLLRNADSAMYQAKALGRNTYSFFTREMNAMMLRRLEVEQQMRDALQRNEFQVYYQPQFAVETNKLIGAEALLRWNSPVLGDITPDEFIPVAEQTGLIISLGQFVVTQALAFLEEWHNQQQIKYRVSVNLSPRQFRGTELFDFIEKSLKNSTLGANSLELEITEGVLMIGQSYVDDALESLNKLGIILSMDDFGTGYSSLSYLQQYSFDILKIDRSFIKGLTSTKSDFDLVKATIAMAHSFDLKVVAEGVETKKQVELLTKLQCDYLQGYYFSEPIPAKALINFSLKHQP